MAQLPLFHQISQTNFERYNFTRNFRSPFSSRISSTLSNIFFLHQRFDFQQCGENRLVSDMKNYIKIYLTDINKKRSPQKKINMIWKI